jgi:predicted metalloprotease with PDZ domain
LEQASLQAWEGASEGYDGLSYYLKGGLVGFYLDLRLRNGTQGSMSLDDVMRELYETYGRRDLPYPATAIEAAIAKVSGLNLSHEYRRYVAGTDDIAWEEVLPQAGFRMTRQADGFVGASFMPSLPADETDESDETDRSAIVQRVEPGYPAAKMDLRPGDRLVAIDGKEVTYGVAGAMVRSLPAAVPIRFVVVRRGKTLELHGEVGTQYSHHTLTFAPHNEQTVQSRRILLDMFASRGTIGEPQIPGISRTHTPWR